MYLPLLGCDHYSIWDPSMLSKLSNTANNKITVIDMLAAYIDPYDDTSSKLKIRISMNTSLEDELTHLKYITTEFLDFIPIFRYKLFMHVCYLSLVKYKSFTKYL